MKKYKQILIVFLLSIKAYASQINAIIPLAGGGIVAAKTSLSLSLNNLASSARYSVVCYIDTTYALQYLYLSTNFTDNTSTIFSYNINGNTVRQDQLISGHNIIVMEGQFSNPTTDTLVFTNLDQTNPFNVNNCFAIPVTNLELL